MTSGMHASIFLNFLIKVMKRSTSILLLSTCSFKLAISKVYFLCCKTKLFAGVFSSNDNNTINGPISNYIRIYIN